MKDSTNLTKFLNSNQADYLALSLIFGFIISLVVYFLFSILLILTSGYVLYNTSAGLISGVIILWISCSVSYGVIKNHDLNINKVF